VGDKDPGSPSRSVASVLHVPGGPFHPGWTKDLSAPLYVIKKLKKDRGSTVVKVQRYKAEGRWFDPRWCHWKFSLA
jgi:hypothetical protein